MRAWRCGMCEKAVTEADLKAGNGKIINKKVYCVEHAAAAAGQAAAPAEDAALEQAAAPARATRRRARAGADPSASGTRSTARRTARSSRRSAPVEDDGYDDAMEPKSKTPMILGIFGVIILILVGVVVYLIMGGETPPEGPVTPQPDVVDTDQPDPEPEPNPILEPEPEPAPEPEPEPDAADAGPTEADFEERITQAENHFDGSIAGFEKGARVLNAGIINSDLFKGSGYIAQAQAILDEQQAVVDSVIEQEYTKLRERIQEAMDLLQQKQALAIADEFPREYRRFGDWGERHKGLHEEIKANADSMYKDWITAAKNKIDDGRADSAVAELKEIIAAADGQLLPSIEDKLNKQISLIKAGGSVAGSGDAAASAAGLLSKAHQSYTFGNLVEAETIYTQLLKGFANDAAVQKDRGVIDTRLQEIEASKSRGADEEIKVLLYEDFEEVWSNGKHGNFWKTGTRQKVKTYAKSGNAMKTSSRDSNKYSSLALSGGTPSDMAAWINDDNAYFAFRYFLELNKKSESHTMRIQCMNRTQSDNFNISLKNPVVGEWAYACIPLAKWNDNAHQGKKPAAGDVWSSITIYYGKKGETGFTMYIDNLAVVAGSSLYHMPDKLEAKGRTIAEISSNSQKDFYRMNIRILEEMISKIGAKNNKDVILMVSGAHGKSGLLGSVRKETKGKVIKVRGAGTPAASIDDLLAMGLADIKSKKPGAVFLLIGINDILKTFTLEKQKESDPAKFADLVIPNPAEGIQEKLQAFVDEAFSNGCLPILCTLPASGNDKINSRITDINIAVNSIARMNYLPMIDAYNMFAVNENTGKFYASDIFLNRSGYNMINEKFVAIFKVLQKYAFKK